MRLAHGFDHPTGLDIWVLWLVAIPITVIVHEAGHRLAGRAMGWQLIHFGFGPFEFSRENEGWKRHRVKMLPGAFVRQVPPSFTSYRRQKATTLLSGPMASLIFGLACAAIASTAAGSRSFELFGWFAVLSLASVLELIPRYRKGIGSDGYRLWQVIRGGQPVDDLIRESMAQSSNFTALRFRDWPHSVIVRLAAGQDSYNLYLACLHTIDSGDLEAAAEYMRRLIAQMPQEKPQFHHACEAAYWLASHGGDPIEARKWLERAGGNIDPEVRLRAEAAVALAEGQPDRAGRLAKDAVALLRAGRACGSGEYEMDRLRPVLAGAAAAGASLTAMLN
jgi:hypothetical protein